MDWFDSSNSERGKILPSPIALGSWALGLVGLVGEIGIVGGIGSMVRIQKAVPQISRESEVVVRSKSRE